MKKIQLLIFLLGFTLVAFTTAKNSKKVKTVQLTPKAIQPMNVDIVIKKVDIPLKTHNDFLEALGHKESGNRYDIVNTFGYMGKYQFGMSTLEGLGYSLSKEEFLNSPYIQEKAMQKLLAHNKKKLNKYIVKYEGKVLHGVLVTESGVLAAAHLGGAGNVRKWFRKGKEFKDGYGTSLTNYMTKFSGYNLNV